MFIFKKITYNLNKILYKNREVWQTISYERYGESTLDFKG